MRSIMLFFMILRLFLSASFGNAIPLIPRDVVSPPITSPTLGTVWHSGDKRTVTWDISNLPAMMTNPIGMLVLGFLANGSENLMLDQPLAKGFNLTDAQVEITVPSVPTQNNYILVLFGDSGNASPEFTINGVSSPVTTSSSESSLVALVTPSPPITTASSGSSVMSTSTTPTTTASSGSSSPVMATSSIPVKSTPTSISMPTTTSLSTSTSSTPSSSATPSTAPSSANAACKMHGLDPTMAYYFGAALMAFLNFF